MSAGPEGGLASEWNNDRDCEHLRIVTLTAKAFEVAKTAVGYTADAVATGDAHQFLRRLSSRSPARWTSCQQPTGRTGVRWHETDGAQKGQSGPFHLAGIHPTAIRLSESAGRERNADWGLVHAA